MPEETIEDQINQKAAELESLLNKAPIGISAYIETHSVGFMESDKQNNLFSIRIEFTRRIYP